MTKYLRKEEDENPQVACTSQLQQWNKKGGVENIVPKPVMEVVGKKTNLMSLAGVYAIENSTKDQSASNM